MNCATPEAATTATSVRIGAVQDIKNAMFNEEESKLNSDETKSTITEFFPWVSEFKKMCKCIYSDKSMTSLAELMQYYIRNMSVSVNKCSIKPLRAAKLKDSISETLLLFLYMYRELSEDRNRSIYLNNMSDLLALYIDMELKASKKSNEDHSEICTRLTSCLYVYLEHSTEHLLDTLIKLQFMCRNYHHILDPIITKVTKNIPAHPESNVMYVRYLLIYCLWRKINIDMTVRREITTTAIASLGTPPATFPPCLLEDVLPKVPKCQPNSAKHLMHHKFDIRKCCELFIQFCKENRGDIRQEKGENVTTIPSSSRRSASQLLEVTPRENENMDHIENKCNFVSSDKNTQSSRVSSDNLKSLSLNEQVNVKPLGTISTNISVARTIIPKSVKPKVLSRKKSKSTKIVLIDLTSDTAFERHIAKRKSRKVAWLEEAKKLDAKTIKASQKMKKQQTAGNTNCLETSTFEQRSEDSIQSTCAKNAFTKNDLKSSATWETKTDKIKSKQYFETEHTVSAKSTQSVSVDTDSSDKSDVVIPCALSSVIVNKPQSNKYKTSTNSLANVSSDTDNVNRYHDVGDTSEANHDKTFNDRRNIQTVIKRLIEQDAIPESETNKRNESLTKICDLETEHCKTVNTSPAICVQDNSKDKACNAIYLSTTKDKLSSPMVHMLWKNNERDETMRVDEKADDISDNERYAQEDSRNKSNEVRYSKSIRVDSELSENKVAISTTAAETRVVTTISNAEVSISNTMESDRLQQLRIIKNTSEEAESQDEYVSVKNAIANNIVNFNVMNEDPNVQTDLRVGTCIKVNDGVKDSKFSNCNIRENIFEDHAAGKKTISNILDVSLCSNKEGAADEKDIKNMKTDRDQKSPEIVSDRNKECNIEERRHALSAKDAEEDGSDQTYDRELLRSPQTILHANIQDSLENRCIIHNSELHGNIDGLSLLANVVTSQHGSHSQRENLAERELKVDQIKVKDYASLRSSPCNQNIDDETDTSGSLNAVSRILENSTTEVVNRIVGIYPDDALGKVAHHIEVTSTTDVNRDDCENESSNNIPHIVHTSINYETDMLSNNINLAESNVQSKENTNVILNGETVVLLQKSPNSNLYIINKAVENARDHNGEDETCLIREKSWMIPPEDCASFEVVNATEHIPFNLEISQYKNDLTCQEKKFSISRTKGIKIEPEEENRLMAIAEMKPYSKKGSLSSEVISATTPIYQDTNVANVSISKSTDKRKSKSILTYRQNIKQEFNHITPNCGIQGCNGIHSHSHEVIDSQHSLHIPVTHPTTISSIYGNCAAGTDLCMPYHKHCTSVSCSLQINSTASLHSHTKTANSCGRSHCSCLDCRTYDIVTHCRQYIHPARDSHVSCIESNSYFLPAHSSVQTSAVQEHDRTKSEAVISKLYDDQILCKIEQRVSLQNNALEKLDMQREPEKLFKKDVDKLPLKKRLKAHAMMGMAYEELPIKAEKLDSYPGIPMMSIAALESLDGAQKHPSQIIKSSYELSSNEENRSHGSYHFNSNIVRRDYYKDMHISNSRHNLAKESARSHERPFRPNGDQSNAMCLETCQERTFKAPAQCRDMSVTNSTSLKRMEADTMEQDSTCKKAKKTQSSIRQTRSSKRNVPKVNYCYTDVDPEWNPSGESKRRRKKTSR